MKTLYTGKWMYTGNEKGEIIEDFAMMVEDDKIIWIKPEAEAEASKESIDSAIEILEEFAVSPIAKLEDSLPRALANEFFEIAREYSFSSFSDDENIAMKVLLRETKNKYI